jgi:hypothetical protein
MKSFRQIGSVSFDLRHTSKELLMNIHGYPGGNDAMKRQRAIFKPSVK